MAKLYFYFASMNAGKSTTLLQADFNYRERGMATMLWTASLDTRSQGMPISSRIGLEAEAHRYHPATDFWTEVGEQHTATPLSCIMVDEAQFLAPDQVWQLARVADEAGIPVLCYGLRTDFKGALFPGSAALLGIADALEELKAVCHCGRKATMNLRVDEAGRPVGEGAQTEIGGNERYLALCRRHFAQALGIYS
ncbi:thymidine kinase [Alteraurantiacibacter aestuarii]|uniref:Thymidine kinase n=1 Tax=Alteraurantiacibacter aestuarii TaxID=650004 RepID=A0A844ZNW8_9SPHN|nr:thymidine kinase [Alteraurantiacibacter aestuarii]MXO89032.1 thymidine kinase [Alteraurantiacibacter aestuarii]